MRPVDNSRPAAGAGRPAALVSGAGPADCADRLNSSSEESGRAVRSASGYTFAPTTDHEPTGPEWLTPAVRDALKHVLDDLPEQARQLDANYWALVGRGDRDPLDRAVRYPIAFDPSDLADRRTKPDTLGVDIADDAALSAWAGDRRQGILPTLVAWVGYVADAMHRAGVPFTPPDDPDQITLSLSPAGTITRRKRNVTVHSQASWLRHHLDFVYGQPWSTALATDLIGLGGQLNATVGSAQAYPDQHTTLTAPDLAARLDVPYGTIRRWIHEGHLNRATDAAGQPVPGPKGRAVYYLTEGRALQARTPRKAPR